MLCEIWKVIRKNCLSDHKYFIRFKNLTLKIFSKKETQLIVKGFKDNMPSNSSTKTFKKVVVEVALKDFLNNTE